MATERLVIGGIVKGGVVVPEGNARLPEGAHVEIVLSAADVSPELKAELAAWERASDEAWAMIDCPRFSSPRRGPSEDRGSDRNRRGGGSVGDIHDPG
jgi:hypothetical protein